MAKPVVVISGASGLIGTELSRSLSQHGYQVRRLVRRPAEGAEEVQWQPSKGSIDSAQLEGCFGVIHLAGESVAGRWSKEKKEAILQSRVSGTRTLATAICGLSSPPKVWLSASAIGYYGDRGAELLTEQSTPGTDFLSEVCQAWEGEAALAEGVTRVCRTRTGLVLTKRGGALARMLTPFRLGLGGNLANGEQYMSWITLHDTVRAFEHCLKTESVKGPVNFVGPAPVKNAELTRTLGRVLHRATPFPVPKFALKLGFGEFAEGILASQRVVPQALQDSGFKFEHADLETALRAALDE